ncbi:MAG: hypothetical protein WA252_12995 [Candidatus Sulfotelmatobacter sp.]|jgi:hypothetical protein
MTKTVGVFAPLALAIVAFALAPSSAQAQSYSGDFSLTWSVSYGYGLGNHTYCLKLTDNGSFGFPHSGPAAVTGDYVVTHAQGFFQVINNELVATFYVPGGEEIGDVVFVAAARNGDIGDGFAEYSASGAYTDSGALTFGKKGGCDNSQ